ncbi:hypothetical protein [Ruminococcus sp. YRD2003]|uniref:hypothetical protein n=1 Tax=Ruminococcus sp. YRD2003 TaxID=1452313 RepID=UPI00115FDA10
MNDSDNGNTLTILVNTKYSRITVHKSTLIALGLPSFIQLGYNASQRRLMLFGTHKPAQNTIRVVLKHNSFCYIHSRSFMTGLMSVSKTINKEGTYLLKGEMNRQLSAAYFSLDNAERVLESTNRGN